MRTPDIAAIIAAVLAFTNQSGRATAQTADAYFKGKQITMYVGSGPGGGFDQYARVLVPHYRRHIPGEPAIVVKNMPGANGIVAMNFLANSAPRDGTAMLAAFNTAPLAPLFGHPNAKFDTRKLNWIGSIGKQTGTCLTMRSKVKTLAQAQSQESLMGATGNGANPVIFSKLMNAFVGTKFKIITGYTTPGLRLAIEKGEVDGVCGIAWETHMAATPHWIVDKKVTFIAQFGLQESPELKGVPMAINLIANPDERKVFELLAIQQEFGRPIMAPPEVSADRLSVLQRAFLATLKDPAYLADAKRSKQFVNPLTAAEAHALVERAYATPKRLVEKAAAFTAKK
ncbi:MAG: Bug family tripartite tricarboxylate transporter substrate binding protein [Beijerinckiaceae bacterium]